MRQLTDPGLIRTRINRKLISRVRHFAGRLASTKNTPDKEKDVGKFLLCVNGADRCVLSVIAILTDLLRSLQRIIYQRLFLLNRHNLKILNETYHNFQPECATTMRVPMAITNKIHQIIELSTQSTNCT